MDVRIDVDWKTFAFTRFLQYSIVYLTSYAAIDMLTTGRRDHTSRKVRKYDPKLPPQALMEDEAVRGLGSIVVLTLIETLLAYLQSLNMEVLKHVDVLNVGSGHDIADLTIALMVSIFGFWGEFHFYFTHRMLHRIDFLYHQVHAVHHMSKNTDTWSGLSFHPLEAAIYFSALLGFYAFPFLFGWSVPNYIYRAAGVGLIVTPAIIHQGHDIQPLDIQRSSVWYQKHPWLRRFVPHPYHHYIHHKKVVCNFGGFALWDELFGTCHVSESA